MHLKKLSTVAEILSGYTFRYAICTANEGNTYVLQAKNISRSHSIGDVHQLSKVTLPKINSKSLLKKNDIVLVSKGFSRGSFRSTLFMVDDKEVIASSSVLIIRTNIEEVLPEYICTYINSDEGQQKLLSLVSGSYIQSISKRRFDEEFVLPIPSIQEQRLIVNLSKNISMQSEYNNRKNILLETILDSVLKFPHIS
jgi:restriction endonuclease S subunit